MNRTIQQRLVLMVTLSLSLGVNAANLGTMGDVYPIAEPDFLTTIHLRLANFKQNGGLLRQEKVVQNRVRHDILNPKVLPLIPAEQRTTTNFTPSYTLTQPIYAQGKLLYPAGTTVYPLHQVRLHEVLLFFNGTDPSQVAWAKKVANNYPFVKRILTGGNIATLSKALGRVYYDQYGTITKALHVTHVPAIVKQVGQHLVITEVGKPSLPTVNHQAGEKNA